MYVCYVCVCYVPPMLYQFKTVEGAANKHRHLVKLEGQIQKLQVVLPSTPYIGTLTKLLGTCSNNHKALTEF
jgi:hypothetical protein